jgi:hypothetical protein
VPRHAALVTFLWSSTARPSLETRLTMIVYRDKVSVNGLLDLSPTPSSASKVAAYGGQPGRQLDLQLLHGGIANGCGVLEHPFCGAGERQQGQTHPGIDEMEEV